MKESTAKISNSISQKSQNRRGLIRFLVITLLFWLGFYFWPVLLDATPPTLELSGIETGKTYQGSITLNISVSDEKPGLRSLTAQIDDDIPEQLRLARADYTSWTLDTTLLPDGEHRISVTAIDKSLRQNVNRKEMVLSVDNTPPRIQLLPESFYIQQGKTLGIFVRANETLAEITGQIFNRTIKLYPIGSEGLYRSLVGVSVTQPVKSYPLRLKATDLVGHTTNQTCQVEVGKTIFERGAYIVLSPEKQKIMMDKSKSREDNTKRANAYAKQEPSQLWEDKFMRPTEGRLTSPFGKYREYNTGVRRHHLGTDIANVVGTPVYAGNDGIVTLADRLHIYGNAVIINHGQGVSTSYNHLSEINVKVGEDVKKRQLIGLMGATGQVTGSHLHWHMVVNGGAVDPEEWTERNFSSSEGGKSGGD